MFKLSLGHKLSALVGLGILGMGAVVVFSLYQSRANIMEERGLAMRSLVESAHGILAHYEKQARDGKLGDAAAREQAIAVLRGLRYRGQEYFWVNDMQGRMVMHPIKPELDGQDLSGFKDPNGKRLFVEMVDVVRKDGAGYVFYLWPKPGFAVPVEKISYVKGFAPWGWLIGSGVYLDDVNATFRSNALWLALLALAGAVVLAALGGLLSRKITRQITRPLQRAVSVLEAVAAGDFTQRLEVTTTDELGRMAAALNQAVEAMCSALQEVSDSADHAARASREISAASGHLSSGAQAQAASLEETAASLEEITGTVKQNADNAHQANQLAAGSRDAAEKGGQVVTRAVEAMGEINRSSRKIADIITTIDEIAFQTNLLALNAAVEAARAGEQGRGFAVVAAEVRSLAQRSATAAREIKGLIEDSVAKVGVGSELVNRSGQTLQDIVGSVKRVNDIIAEISAALQAQATGIDQVNKAVAEIDHVTQSTAAQTEELASTAQSMSGQAQRLQELVGQFNLGAEHAVRQLRREPPAAKLVASSLPARRRLPAPQPEGELESVR